MATDISLEEAETKLRQIVSQLGPDEEVVITENGQPVASLVGRRSKGWQRPGPGFCKGMLTIVADDDEHLDDFKEYMP